MATKLIVGLGSPFGDDQAGWLVADKIRAQSPPHWDVRRATVPLDLLDWLEGADRLGICDACATIDRPGRLHHWQWPSSVIATCRSLGSHDFSIPNVLELAATLGILPNSVSVWGIEINTSTTSRDVSAPVAKAIAFAAAEIRKSLQSSTTASR